MENLGSSFRLRGSRPESVVATYNWLVKAGLGKVESALKSSRLILLILAVMNMKCRFFARLQGWYR